MKAHQLTDVTVVADAGMISSEQEGHRRRWALIHPRRQNPDDSVPDQQVAQEQSRFHTAGPVGVDPAVTSQFQTSFRRDQVVYYQYSADRARRSLRGINEQVGQAEKAVAGKLPVKRNRFVTLKGADRSVNGELETKARTLAGWKAYATNIDSPTPQFVIGAYHQLWRIEKSFRMSKSDLAARPIFHHTEDSISAHLTIAFAALAITRVIEARSGWSIKKFVTTARRYRTITIAAGNQTITATDPLPDDLHQALNAIRGGH